MSNLAVFGLPYSTGVKDTMKTVPSLPYDSSYPDFGNTVNSLSDSEENTATNGVKCFELFVSLNETLAVLWSDELMTITSSGSGSLDCSSMKYLHLPPAFRVTSNCKVPLNGLRG